LFRGLTDRINAMDARLAGGPATNDRAAAEAGAGFLAKVLASRQGNLTADQAQRFYNAAATWAGEQVPADGGFAAPPAWAERIERIVFGDSFLGRLRERPVKSSIYRCPVDNTPPWSASGPQAPKVAEGAQVAPSKLSIGLSSVLLFRRSVLVPASEEMVSWGGPAFFAGVEETILARIREAMEAWVAAGTGMDEPLGFLNSTGKIEVAAESGQTAGTISAANVSKMASKVTRLADAVWVSHPRAIEQIGQLPAPIYLGSGGPAGSIFGRPLYTSEHMNDLGSAGDLALVDPNGIVFAVDGPRLANTFAFSFDQNLHSFRCTVEMGSAPKLATPVARKNGSGTASHIVTLAARS
jgi:HK97 family phage major capsid protein